MALTQTLMTPAIAHSAGQAAGTALTSRAQYLPLQAITVVALALAA